MPPSPKLGFALVVGIEDESYNAILVIPKEK
jgi:hypothetical protein